MLSCRFGAIVPSSASEKSAVHLKPCRLARIFAQLRQPFFAAILLIAADQHDLLSLAGTVAAIEHKPLLIGGRGHGGSEGQRRPQNEGADCELHYGPRSKIR